MSTVVMMLLALVPFLVAVLTAKEVYVATTLESRLAYQKYSWSGRTVSCVRTAETMCGPRPTIDFLFPLNTKARFRSYNLCLAEHLARPHVMRILSALLTPLAALLLVVGAYIWWQYRRGLRGEEGRHFAAADASESPLLLSQIDAIRRLVVGQHSPIFWNKVWQKSLSPPDTHTDEEDEEGHEEEEEEGREEEARREEEQPTKFSFWNKVWLRDAPHQHEEQPDEEQQHFDDEEEEHFEDEEEHFEQGEEEEEQGEEELSPHESWGRVWQSHGQAQQQ